MKKHIITLFLIFASVVNLHAAITYEHNLNNRQGIQYDMTENNLNTYAFGLESVLSEDASILNVTYRLNNSNATSVNVLVYNGEEVVATVAGGTTIGKNTVALATANLPKGVRLTWGVEVNGTSVEVPTQEAKTYSFYYPSGLDIDNNPENATFGMLLINEGMQHVKGVDGYVSTGYGAGIYAFTPSFDLLPNADQPGYNGGVEFTETRADGTGTAYAPRRIRISEDGRIFVTSLNTDGNYLWEVNPANMNEWTTVFSGELNDNRELVDAEGNFVAAPNTGFDVKGAGENLQLAMYSVNLPGIISAAMSGFRLHEYNLGTATTWATVPSKTIVDGLYAINSTGTQVEYDNEGGVWIASYRGIASDANPGLVHINADGVEDAKLIWNNVRQAGIRFNNDFTKLVVAGNNGAVMKATIYSVSKDENGAPVLTEEIVIDMAVIGKNLNDFAWDYAGNLYSCSNSAEKLAAWAMPYSGKVVTPAAAEYAFQIGEPVEYVNICQGETYIWAVNNQIYSETGIYNLTTNDGIFILHLTVNPLIYTEETITTCDSYQWNGQTYTQSGDYTYTTTATNGCDSTITLHLTINQTQYAEETITACDSYTWNGQTYTQSGDYTYSTTAINGCDSIATLHLLVYQSKHTEEHISACDNYEWNGQTYTEGGTYIYTTTSVTGCDSIVTLHLTISQSDVGETEYATICYGENFTWNGQTYSTAGEYSITLSNTSGCDSIVTLQLTILPEIFTTEEYATICHGETYTWNGQNYATTGAYTTLLSSVFGCDSTAILHLTVLPEVIRKTEYISAPTNKTVNWRGKEYNETGTYYDTVHFVVNPLCDSVIYMLDLTIADNIDSDKYCGENLTWYYSNGALIITGSGAMYDDPDLLSYRTQDWYPARVNNIVLPEAITHIGNVAFADCANLTSIVIPSSVTSIGDGAFSWTGLQVITIPASVTELGEQVFETCNDLRTILYEGNPIAINNQTVHPLIGCVRLDTIIAPAALWHCTTADPALEARYGVPHKARYIEVTDGELTNQAIKYIANNSGAMEILDLTNATNTTLPYGAWSNSYQLFTLYLPQQLEVIPESMVEGARNLSEIAIPATVMEIGNYAFAGCVNVWRMTVDAVIPPKVYENTFDGISRSISVQVPAGSEELYREAAYWREFFIEHTNHPLPITNCQKLLRKDQILILRNGKVYTTMGQLINTEE